MRTVVSHFWIHSTNGKRTLYEVDYSVTRSAWECCVTRRSITLSAHAPARSGNAPSDNWLRP